MKLKLGVALMAAVIACGAQARDMQSIQQSGELKVGVPGTTRRWPFITAPANLSATTSIWRTIWGKRWE